MSLKQNKQNVKSKTKSFRPFQVLQHHHMNVPLYKHVLHDLDEQNAPKHNIHVLQRYDYPEKYFLVLFK